MNNNEFGKIIKELLLFRSQNTGGPVVASAQCVRTTHHSCTEIRILYVYKHVSRGLF